MIQLVRRLFAAFAIASAASQAAPMSPDPTGNWYLPPESGWGVTIAQQGEVLFVTLLVYDEQRRPEWFVASNVRDAGGGVFSGALYRTSGPWFGTAFDPSMVNSRIVGNVSLDYAVNFGGQASLRVRYSVDGVEVTRNVIRLTWGSDATRLVGAYYGGINYASLAPVTQPEGCGSPPSLFPPGGEIRINLSGNSIFIIRDEGVDIVNLIGGEYAQSGQFGVIDGFLFRGVIVNPLKIADVQVTNLVISDDGFIGHVRVTVGANCAYEGSIGAVRR